MTEEELQAIQAGTVEDVSAAVEGIESLEDLAALHELEAADASPRKGVFDAIEKRAAALAPNGDKPKDDEPKGSAPPAEAASKPAAKPAAAAAAAPAPWKARDYTGPLTGDQAAWRNKHIKPVTGARTK